ncbi:MAG: ribosome-associated translation inhibitor RaiA [Candidatus Aureabacteria bacterium]|nr:ribosome-associated translation inhibitor RaiA [Candidatus Auribacterota bacterium]
MKIQLTGRHVEVTEAMKSFTEEKLYTLNKYFHALLKAHVLMEVQNYNHKCEINLHGRHLNLNASETTKNMYESISKCVDKLENQLRAYNHPEKKKRKKISLKDMEQEIVGMQNDLLLQETV